jgi:hypothetical protein
MPRTILKIFIKSAGESAFTGLAISKKNPVFVYSKYAENLIRR